jgi:cytochrome oxidase Cu insertion factor (SCO1/SenC/PrrC family)
MTRPRGPLARVATAALLLGIMASTACRRTDPLPVLGALPPFSLTERSGRAVTADDLRGQVWVAAFVFTRCPDVCPALTARMAGLRTPLATVPGNVRLVSLSVDPLHDTPPVLRDYADRHGAGPDWWFLTGPRDTVVALLRDGFRVAFADDGPPSAPITHSDRFVLVDRGLQVRGYYHGNDSTELDRLVADARRLAGEPPA